MQIQPRCYIDFIFIPYTACGHRIAHWKWKETKQQPGTAGPGNMLGCCFVSFHFLWAILCPHNVQSPFAKNRRLRVETVQGGSPGQAVRMLQIQI